MEYPVVEVKTADNTALYGLLLNPHHKKLYLHVHGTGANFFYNSHFLKPLADMLDSHGYTFLSANHHGSEIYDYWKDTPTKGSAHEFFENCLQDIDAWLEFAFDHQFQTILLSGHSLGSEKVTYYMAKGKYKDKINACALLGFSDSFGCNQEYAGDKLNDYLREARVLVDQGKSDHLLSNLLIHAGYLPQTAASYLNFFSPNSELSQALPLRQGRDLKLYQQITVPILGVIGDAGEFTVTPVTEAIDLLRRENPHAQIYQVLNCDHEYHGKESEVVSDIEQFIRQI